MNSHLRALITMATTQAIMDGLLIYLVASKFDRHTREKWEEGLQANKLLKWKDMATFLEKRCRMLENIENAMVIQTPSKQIKLFFHCPVSRQPEVFSFFYDGCHK
ncbi:uncharacterized protein LOC122320592 [Drosophila ficusphila]|uniref:uncharacterized protein LOC122320592 n=1 Tax=Drosophila ficusphila TaxID=30025 RepID=UPI001C894BED|nr:uncharacterized protein LOC122320592 [Drosophila ficusphila]